MIEALHRHGAIRGWRNECYAVTTSFDAPALFHIERAAARFFGTTTYAALTNALRNARTTVTDSNAVASLPATDPTTTNIWWYSRAQAKALGVLQRSPKGFVLMIEGASIDKQAHAMDTERWMMDTLEFDRAVRVARDFAAERACDEFAEVGGGAIVNRGGLLIAADADDDWIHVCGTESGDSTRTADDAYARVRTRLK